MGRNESVRSFIVSKFKRLIVPFWVYAWMCLGMKIVMQRFRIGDITLRVLFHSLIPSNGCGVNDALWFLIVSFEALVIHGVLLRLVRRLLLLYLAIAFAMTCMGIIIGTGHLPFLYLNTVLTSSIFIAVGFASAKYLLAEEKIPIVNLCLALLGLSCVTVACFFLEKPDLHLNILSQFPALWMVVAILGSFSVILISKILANVNTLNHMLSWFGRYSLPFVGLQYLNFLAFHLFYKVRLLLFRNIDFHPSFQFSAMFFIAVLMDLAMIVSFKKIASILRMEAYLPILGIPVSTKSNE
ncbi:MAG: hypothetical protein BWX73_00939 [Lentisphaerae bacterium ADurb.Bin082]|nr:MAG: hypothetical protein BWX73_00939 [Lentisphaerae bacterium ADurb.Bin082]